MDKNFRRQDHHFSTRLPYAEKKTREIWMKMTNTAYNSTEDMNNKLQSLKGKTKLEILKNINNYFDDMNIRMVEDPFAENVQGISKNHHRVILLMKILQTKPRAKILNIDYYGLYYTVIRNRDEKKL